VMHSGTPGTPDVRRTWVDPGSIRAIPPVEHAPPQPDRPSDVGIGPKVAFRCAHGRRAAACSLERGTENENVAPGPARSVAVPVGGAACSTAPEMCQTRALTAISFLAPYPKVSSIPSSDRSGTERLVSCVRGDMNDVAEEIDHHRRRFLRRAAMAIAAAHVGMFGPAEAEGAPRELAALGRASEWLNSPHLTPESLNGKVVLVDFWTYTCINWLRTLPYVRAWAQKYRDGLVVIGVHTPEFPIERDIDNVRRAVRQM